MTKTNPSVDGYIRKNKPWSQELEALRRIVLECGLTEEIKWCVPCYTFEEHNVVFLGSFKDACTLSFVKGALLKDSKEILELPGPNTQSARVIRFTEAEQITKLKPTLKAYIREAIEAEKAGLKVAFKKIDEHETPEELQAKFDDDPAFEKAFRALTPGRQRAYLIHFSGAKQSKTRTARIAKHTQRILEGKGLND